MHPSCREQKPCIFCLSSCELHPICMASTCAKCRSKVSYIMFLIFKLNRSCALHPIKYLPMLSKLWWIPKSVSIGYGSAMRMGLLGRFQRYPTKSTWFSSQLPFAMLYTSSLKLAYRFWVIAWIVLMDPFWWQGHNRCWMTMEIIIRELCYTHKTNH